MKYGLTILLLLIIQIHFACSHKENPSSLSVTYSCVSVNNNLVKVIFQIRNNDSVDYFIPFIKPISYYCKFSDSISKNILLDPDPNYILTNNILKREDLIETAQIDSLIKDMKSDSLIFYFAETFAKKYYDSILGAYKDKKELRFIYPYFYHAIGNGCIYIKKNSTRNILMYCYSTTPVNPDKLNIIVTFNSKTNPFYKETYFKNIPNKIEDYRLFKGQIQQLQQPSN